MSRNAVHNMVPTFPQLNDWQEKALIVALRLQRRHWSNPLRIFCRRDRHSLWRSRAGCLCLVSSGPKMRKTQRFLTTARSTRPQLHCRISLAARRREARAASQGDSIDGQ